MNEKNIKTELKKKNISYINLVEGTRRLLKEDAFDEENSTSWKDTLLLIVTFFLYTLFG
ncbi:hypothetical protein [Desemzia sp. FAM 23991]|uniref:hypothetical protein n=1 Tax=unclassified Desemzia TaxID=2685243 RepID=UPI003887ED40